MTEEIKQLEFDKANWKQRYYDLLNKKKRRLPPHDPILCGIGVSGCPGCQARDAIKLARHFVGEAIDHAWHLHHDQRIQQLKRDRERCKDWLRGLEEGFATEGITVTVHANYRGMTVRGNLTQAHRTVLGVAKEKMQTIIDIEQELVRLGTI